MTILDIRSKISDDIFSYLELTDALSSYSNVRDKIRNLLRRNEIIRIKTGLYMFPDVLRREPVNSFMLANLIYGPSYVSCESALSYHGLIPESVPATISISFGRSRSFETVLGRFEYHRRATRDYSQGVEWRQSNKSCFLIASPLKAVYDKASLDSRFNGEEIGQYLFEDLRIDCDALKSCDWGLLEQLKPYARGRMLKLLNFLEELR